MPAGTSFTIADKTLRSFVFVLGSLFSNARFFLWKKGPFCRHSGKRSTRTAVRVGPLFASSKKWADKFLRKFACWQAPVRVPLAFKPGFAAGICRPRLLQLSPGNDFYYIPILKSVLRAHAYVAPAIHGAYELMRQVCMHHRS